MIKSEKPNKRVMFYWFVEYGFFFLLTSFFLTGTILRFATTFYTLSLFFLELALITIVISFIFLLYTWLTTEYFLLKKHIIIKEGKNSVILPYNNIRKVGLEGSMLQHMIGTTNIKIKTGKNETYYLKGIRNYKQIEEELLKKMK